METSRVTEGAQELMPEVLVGAVHSVHVGRLQCRTSESGDGMRLALVAYVWARQGCVGASRAPNGGRRERREARSVVTT